MAKTNLYWVNSKDHPQKTPQFVKQQLKANHSIIYVSANKPWKRLIEWITEKGIHLLESLYIADCVTKQLTKEMTELKPKNVYLIESPGSLTHITIAVDDFLEKTSGKKTAVVDSLGTLLAYNGPGTIGKFANFLVNKMKLAGVQTVLLMIETDSEKLAIQEIGGVLGQFKKI